MPIEVSPTALQPRNMPRYAVYWLPEPDHPLWSAGCRWLGRDPTADKAGTPPPGRAEPWRYGFHATLKAPITLVAGAATSDFLAAVKALATETAPITLPPLAVDELDGFVALRPTAAHAGLQRLAERCVTVLDRFRAPMPAAELERRAPGLDPAQRALLARWGYPHVLDQWRLHLTLSDRLPDPLARAACRREAEAAFAAALAVPLQLSSLSVLEQPDAGQPFRLLSRWTCEGRAEGRA